jgi:type VI protein secretion system component VasK
MVAQGIGFTTHVMELLGNVTPFTLACILALMIRSKLQAVLVVVNLCLLMELIATMVEPGYHFGDQISVRLVASAIQVAVAYGAITWWRSRRVESESVTAR